MNEKNQKPSTVSDYLRSSAFAEHSFTEHLTGNRLSPDGWHEALKQLRAYRTFLCSEISLQQRSFRRRTREYNQPNKRSFGKLRYAIVSVDLQDLSNAGGLDTAHVILAEAFASCGFEITLFFAGEEHISSEKEQAFRELHPRLTLEVLPPIDLIPTGPFARHRSEQTYRALKDRNFDVIIFHERQGVPYYSMLAKYAGIAFHSTLMVIAAGGPTQWSLEANRELPSNIDLLEMQFMERQSVELADAIWTETEYMQRWLLDAGWNLPGKRIVFPLALEMRTRTFAPRRAVGTDPEIVFFGRLETRSGIELLADALDIIEARHPGRALQVTFIGPLGNVGAKPANVYVRERAHRWRHSIQLAGETTHRALSDYLSSGDKVVVIPSVADNVSHALRECCANRMPLIAAAVGGISELLDPSCHAEVLFEGRPEDLATKLLNVLGGARPIGVSSSGAKSHLESAREFAANLAASPVAVSREPDRLPRVSVCITHRNRSGTLRQALESIARQSTRPHEIIIVDDGSDDPKSIAFLQSLEPAQNGAPIVVIRAERQCRSSARNLAAASASGDYIFFLEDENLAQSDAINLCVRTALNTGADIVTCFLDCFEGTGHPDDTKTRIRYLPLGNVPESALFSNLFGGALQLFKRETFLGIGGCSEDFGIASGHRELLARAVLSGKQLEVCPEALGWYRRSADGAIDATDSYESTLRSIRPFLRGLPDWTRRVLEFALGEDQRREPDRQRGSVQNEQTDLDRFLALKRKRLVLNSPSGFHLIRGCDTLELRPQDAGLEISANDADPKVFLPELQDADNQRLTVRVRIIAPGRTRLQIFYRSRAGDYTEGASEAVFLSDGPNDVIAHLPPVAELGPLRLDPGEIAGDYRIELIEIRSDS
ncbi:MAG: glycosyltransferase [Bdellovibrionota bacterium]